MSNPMVGDTVWFYPSSEDANGLAHFGTWPLAAIVVCAYDEGSVNLNVFDPDGGRWFRANVLPRAEGDVPKEGFFEERSKPAAAHHPKKKRK